MADSTSYSAQATQYPSTPDDSKLSFKPVRVKRSGSRKTAVRVTLYLGMSYLLLYPILSTPVIADDFISPFYQSTFYKANDQSAFLEAISYGWRSGTELSNFRVIGNLIGSLWLWLWLTMSTKLNVSMHSIYTLTKFIIYVVAAISIATFWWTASRHYGRGIRYWDGLVLSSVALFGTIQNHGLWSNDPVMSYPLAGYGSTAISFGVLTAAVLAVHHQRLRFCLLAASASTISILYYELSLGAVFGAGIILGAGCWVHRSDRRLLINNVIRTAMALGIPALVLIYGRQVALNNRVAYSGTQIGLSGTPKVFVLDIVNSIPGSAWSRTLEHLGGLSVFIGCSLGTVVVLACLLLWWRRTSSSLQLNPCRDAPGVAAMRVAIVASVGVCALGAIGLQAMTLKVQVETPGLGYVYTHYAISSGAVALGLAILAHSLLARRRVASNKVSAIAVGKVLGILAGLILIYAQSTINWQLLERLNAVFTPHRQLLSSFDKDVDERVRCQALSTWTGGGWPDYYEDDMVNGLQHAYKVYFGEEFCKGFVRVN